MIKKIFYSIAVSLAIRLIAVWLLWNHWSFLTIVAYVIFEVLYTESRNKYKNARLNKNI